MSEEGDKVRNVSEECRLGKWYELTASWTTRLRVELREAKERGKRWASVEKMKSSRSSGTSSSSANKRNRYLKVSANTKESIL